MSPSAGKAWKLRWLSPFIEWIPDVSDLTGVSLVSRIHLPQNPRAQAATRKAWAYQPISGLMVTPTGRDARAI